MKRKVGTRGMMVPLYLTADLVSFWMSLADRSRSKLVQDLLRLYQSDPETILALMSRKETK